jgi:hypothetical protein
MVARSFPVAVGVRPQSAVGDRRMAQEMALSIVHNLGRPPRKQPTVRETDAHAQGNIIGIDCGSDRGQKDG